MADEKKYLDWAGLSYYHGKLQGWTNARIAEEITNTVSGYYTKAEVDAFIETLEQADAALQTNIDNVKATADAAAGLWTKFLAGLDSNSDPAPTLKTIADFITATNNTLATLATTEALNSAKSELEGKISAKVDQTAYDNKVATLATTEALNSAKSELQGNIDKKVDQESYNNTVATLATTEALNSAKSELQGNIDKKVDQESYNNTVATLATTEALNSAKSELQGNIDKKVDQESYNATVATLATKTAVEGLDGRLTTAEGKIEALSNATYFKGVTQEGDAAITNGSTNVPASIYPDEATPRAGDVIVSGNKEFIWDGAKWVELGDTTAELQAINKNAEDIAKNAGAISKNAEDIAKNAGDIVTINGTLDNHTNSIAKNAEDIAKNAGDIAKNAEDIAANTSSIKALEELVTGSEGEGGVIATMQAAISKNTEDIAANAAAIGSFARITNDEIDDLFPVATA